MCLQCVLYFLLCRYEPAHPYTNLQRCEALQHKLESLLQTIESAAEQGTCLTGGAEGTRPTKGMGSSTGAKRKLKLGCKGRAYENDDLV